MDNRKKTNLGDEIKNIVQDGLNNKDFKKLNIDVKNFVNDALEEVRRSIDLRNIKSNDDHSSNSTGSNKTTYKKENIKKWENKSTGSTLRTTNLIVPKGEFTGMMLTVFGVIGSSAFGIAVFVLTLLGYSTGAKGLFHTIAIGLLPFLILSIISWIKGSSIRKRLKRFKNYIFKMGDRDYFLIEDLSRATGSSKKFIANDLHKMIDIGMFPQGHIDEKKTNFMLTDELYEQYLQLKKNIAMKDLDRSKEIKGQSKDINYQDKEDSGSKLTSEIRDAIFEGRNFVTRIKEANVIIPGEEISLKLDKLEEVTRKIFDYVEMHPEKFNEIKKFTEYFLPTTLKLVDTYTRLDNHSVQGVNILNAKKEIEETMDTINLAFSNLLDDLFYDVAMDVSTDISVLETMLAQEGLTENMIRNKNKTGEDKNE
nr:5-bromo-4-chloroindolyl phosphate hydrolysis family protein [Tissierella sp.]